MAKGTGSGGSPSSFVPKAFKCRDVEGQVLQSHIQLPRDSLSHFSWRQRHTDPANHAACAECESGTS